MGKAVFGEQRQMSPRIPPLSRGRRAITLLEVLISIGILSIGLSSVAALFPAARSQASRAAILDRAAVLAANALADAATSGMLLEGALTTSQATGQPIVIDPGAVSPYLLSSASGADLRNTGVYSGVLSGGAALPTCQRLFTESRDDIVVAPGATTDDLPLNVFGSDGVRAYTGRMTCLICITPTGGVATTAGTLAVVVFHARDPELPVVAGTVSANRLELAGNTGSRTFRDIVKPGVVLWDGNSMRFHQAAAAAVDSAGERAYLTLSSGAVLNGAVQLLPDSVGLAVRPYFAETAGPYTQ